MELIYDLAGVYEVTPEAIYPGLRIIMNNNFGISDSSPNNEVIDAFKKQATLDTQWNGK